MDDEFDTDAYLRLSAWVEKWLLRALAALLLLLVAAQAFLQVPAVRRVVVPVDRLEGVPYHYRRFEPAASPEGPAAPVQPALQGEA